MPQDQEQMDYESRSKALSEIAKHPICSALDKEAITQSITQHPKLLYAPLHKTNYNVLEHSANDELKQLLHELAGARLVSIVSIVTLENYQLHTPVIRALLKTYPSLMITKLQNPNASEMCFLKDFKIEVVYSAIIQEAMPYFLKLIHQDRSIVTDHVSDVKSFLSFYPNLLTAMLTTQDDAVSATLGIKGREMYRVCYNAAKNRFIEIAVKSKVESEDIANEISMLVSKYPKLLIESMDNGTPLLNCVAMGTGYLFHSRSQSYLASLLKGEICSLNLVADVIKVISLYPKLLTAHITEYHTALELANRSHNLLLVDTLQQLIAQPPADKFHDQATQTDPEVDSAGALLLAIDNDIPA